VVRDLLDGDVEAARREQLAGAGDETLAVAAGVAA
jgi:hypothetical protein